MSERLTFDDLFTFGSIFKETDLIEHRHFSEFLSMYDGNHITFKQNPSLEDFLQSEKYLKAFHLSKKQDHLKFRFPHSFTFPKE